MLLRNTTPLARLARLVRGFASSDRRDRLAPEPPRNRHAAESRSYQRTPRASEQTMESMQPTIENSSKVLRQIQIGNEDVCRMKRIKR